MMEETGVVAFQIVRMARIVLIARRPPRWLPTRSTKNKKLVPSPGVATKSACPIDAIRTQNHADTAVRE